MSIARYLIGVLFCAIALGAVGVGATAVRARLLPGWTGPPARLGDAVVGLTMVLVTAEVLGLFGWFRLAPMVVGLVVVGATASAWARRAPGGSVSEHARLPLPPPRLGPAASYVAVGATAVVVSAWTTRVIEAVRHGPTGIDTLWYHLPIAARFVQSGSITAAHYTDGDAFAASFPSNSALLHALGIMFLGSDLLTPVLNLAFVALALLAAGTIGRSFGVAPATLVCLDAVLAIPVLVITQPGGGYNDIIGIALLLTACALLVVAVQARGSPQPGVVVLAGLAAGFAIGTKYQFAAPVAALTVAVIFLSPRGRRLRATALWLGAVTLTGVFWYARNFVLFDNPLPAVRVELGPITLPQIPSLFSKQSSLVAFLGDGEAWRDHLLPGFMKGLGPVWWAVFALALAGVTLGLLAGGSRARRLLALVGAGSLVGFVTSPAIHDVNGQPALFGSDLRYLAFFLALGAVLLPTVLGRRAWWAIGVAGMVIAATQLDPSIWPTDLRDDRLVEPIRGAEAVAGIAVGAAVLCAGMVLVRAGGLRRRFLPAAAALTAALALASIAVHETYRDGRYVSTPPIPEIYNWAREAHDERIGVSGDLLYLQYPLYGQDLSNHVQYVGRTARHGSYFPINRCEDWRNALNAGDYSYVVTASDPQPNVDAATRHPGDYATWTEADSSATLVRREVSNVDDRGKPRFGYFAYSLFRVAGRFDPDACSG